MQVMVEREAEDFLEKQGFAVANRKICKSITETLKSSKKFGFPIVMKVVSQKILHKSDVGGVVLDIKSNEELKKEFKRMSKLRGFEGVMIQKNIDGAYVLLGLKKDQTFGHVIVVGAGGIYTEIMKDVSFRVCPITREDAQEMLEETNFYKILKGARGKSYNTKPIIDTLMKISNLAKKHPNITELDINPMIVTNKIGKIVDARIIID